ncbi:YlmH/Sll1252 family protein [Bacillaceae bacterium S4-13-56]
MNIYQHYRPEEHPWVDLILSWQEEVGTTYQRKRSDFLNPREQWIFQSVIGKHSDFKWELFGGHPESERKRAILAPFYEEIQMKDFGLKLLRASYPTKFMDIGHRDVLGSFMSLGIKRSKLGDLFVQDGMIQIMIDEDISSYVQMNLTKMKNASVSFQEIALTEIKKSDEKWLENEGTVSSPRLDAILKEIYRLSRSKASEAITRGMIKVNHQLVEDPSFIIQEGDILSFRGKGRAKMDNFHGVTKKDKHRFSYKTLK